MRQFLAVKFRQHDKRTYTYQNDGAPVTVGDRVKVPDRSGDGWSAAEVTAIVKKPPFECKGILGKVTGEDRDKAILTAQAEKVTSGTLDLFGKS